MEAKGAGVPVFMVERYLGALEPSGVEVQAAADGALAGEAASEVFHLHTTYSREDELCFSFFRASSREAVVAANEAARTPFERITEVIVAGGPSADGAKGE